jgi:hypothetical protein
MTKVKKSGGAKRFLVNWLVHSSQVQVGKSRQEPGVRRPKESKESRNVDEDDSDDTTELLV